MEAQDKENRGPNVQELKRDFTSKCLSVKSPSNLECQKSKFASPIFERLRAQVNSAITGEIPLHLGQFFIIAEDSSKGINSMDAYLCRRIFNNHNQTKNIGTIQLSIPKEYSDVSISRELFSRISLMLTLNIRDINLSRFLVEFAEYHFATKCSVSKMSQLELAVLAVWISTPTSASCSFHQLIYIENSKHAQQWCHNLVSGLLSILNDKGNSHTLSFGVSSLVYMIESHPSVQSVLTPSNSVQIMRLILSKGIYPSSGTQLLHEEWEIAICRSGLRRLLSIDQVQRSDLVVAEALTFASKWWKRLRNATESLESGFNTPGKMCEASDSSTNSNYSVPILRSAIEIINDILLALPETQKVIGSQISFLASYVASRDPRTAFAATNLLGNIMEGKTSSVTIIDRKELLLFVSKELFCISEELRGLVTSESVLTAQDKAKVFILEPLELNLINLIFNICDNGTPKDFFCHILAECDIDGLDILNALLGGFGILLFSCEDGGAAALESFLKPMYLRALCQSVTLLSIIYNESHLHHMKDMIYNTLRCPSLVPVINALQNGGIETTDFTAFGEVIAFLSQFIIEKGTDTIIQMQTGSISDEFVIMGSTTPHVEKTQVYNTRHNDEAEILRPLSFQIDASDSVTIPTCKSNIDYGDNKVTIKKKDSESKYNVMDLLLELETVAAKESGLESKLACCVAENRQLHESLFESKKNLQEAVDQLKAVDDLKSQQESLIRDAWNKLALLGNKYAEKELELDRSQGLIAKLQEDIVNITLKASEMQFDLAEARENITSYKAIIGRQQNDIHEIKNDLSTNEDKILHLEEQLCDLKQQIVHERTQRQEETAKRCGLETQLSQKEELLASISANEKLLYTENSRLHDELKSVSERLKQHQDLIMFINKLSAEGDLNTVDMREAKEKARRLSIEK